VSEATPEDRAEQEAPPTGELPPSPTPDVPLEAPAADVQEQAARVGPGEHVTSRDLPLEADPADAAEQSAVVELDEDERR
jgi:hypothetical protein